MSSPSSPPPRSGRSRPTVVMLTAPGVPEPVTLETVRQVAEVRVAHADTLAAQLPGADVLLLWDFFSAALRDAWHAGDALRWIHVAAAGVDAMLFEELRESDVVLTNSQGVFDEPIAEYVLGAILAHDKLFAENARLQARGEWRHRESRRTAGSTALVVGTGGIGRATARLLAAVGMHVRGVGRRAREEDRDFGVVVSSDTLSEHVGWADHVVLAAPLTPATRHLVDARVLAAMRPGTHLVNVGRGALVDEAALAAALGNGELSATLDVFENEPLSSSSPFWENENVRITPHMSGDVLGWRDELARLFEANLRRYVGGRELVNVVDKQAGYVASRA